ncbi:hypothetical protein FACS189440_10090 [Bacteroidia bacterium]|nr:hypothetical protein FACS189440_10090 [Bacteroidia bacterium]
MKKTIFGLLSLLLLTATGMNAQVTIGSKENPAESAVLDLNTGGAGNLGLLLPRVALTSETDKTTTAAVPVPGLMVYATGTAGLAAGVYAWDGSKWQTGSSSTSIVVPYSVTGFTLNTPLNVTRWNTGALTASNFQPTTPDPATLPYVTWQVLSGGENITGVTSGLTSFTFTAVKQGTTVVRATSLDGQWYEDGTININYDPVQTITVTAPTYGSFLLTGKNLQMEKAITPANPTRPDVTWSKDYATGTITQAGVLNIPSISEPSGTVDVRVTASAQDDSGVSGDKVITVHQAVTDFTLTATGTYKKNTPFTVSLTGLTPTNAFDKSISWSATNATLTGQGNTSVTVTPSCASCTVTVTATASDGSAVTKSTSVTTATDMVGVEYSGYLYYPSTNTCAYNNKATCTCAGGGSSVDVETTASANTWLGLFGTGGVWAKPSNTSYDAYVPTATGWYMNADGYPKKTMCRLRL